MTLYMDSPLPKPAGELLQRTPRLLQWLLILSLSAVLTMLISMSGLPAAALIGPMLSGAIAGINGATVRLPKPLFVAPQGVIGVLIATALQPEILSALFDEWLIFIGAVISTVAASSFLGWMISRWRVLPGSTAVWGSAPGAATAMVLMAEAFGADARLVAFMQYLRVVLVAIVAAAIAGLSVDHQVPANEPVAWFPELIWPTFGLTLLVAAAGSVAGVLLRLPSPHFLGALILGVALHLGLGVEFQLPPWLLLAAYAFIGWNIGLNFTRPIVRHALRALPQIIGSIIILIAFCAAIALLLSRTLGMDLLTAYLAMSPGGMDSVAIIAAASSGVNMSFIMAMQLARFLFVLLAGPAIARLVARAVRE